MTHTKLASVWVMDAAIVQVRLGNPLKAVEIMSENAHKVSDAKADYWSLLGELAWYQQKSESVSMAYQKLSQIQPLTSLEQEAFNSMLRIAALRFWLSRLYDKIYPQDGELTHAKNPDHFKNILKLRISGI
ncbi:MAG: hypothetical protein B7Y34_03120 [Methylophilales bacterium 16-45-9]|nr:MAG: hypothetical protein B7Y34_03120 [Methylophilales bacterium 16-45-9]